MTGTEDDADTDTPRVIVGTIHSGGSAVAGSGTGTPVTRSCGCNR
ncbi:MAG: hypothetical protein ACRDNW_16465 [Trebonia sp.]